MTGHALGLVELLLVFGVVIAWALWEIRSTTRSLREDRRRAARQDETRDSD